MQYESSSTHQHLEQRYDVIAIWTHGVGDDELSLVEYNNENGGFWLYDNVSAEYLESFPSGLCWQGLEWTRLNPKTNRPSMRG